MNAQIKIRENFPIGIVSDVPESIFYDCLIGSNRFVVFKANTSEEAEQWLQRRKGLLVTGRKMISIHVMSDDGDNEHSICIGNNVLIMGDDVHLNLEKAPPTLLEFLADPNLTFFGFGDYPFSGLMVEEAVNYFDLRITDPGQERDAFVEKAIGPFRLEPSDFMNLIDLPVRLSEGWTCLLIGVYPYAYYCYSIKNLC